MALFPQFPYSNLHELNLDWLIEQISQLMENGTVISVNGMSGVVTLYTDKNVVFPDRAFDPDWSVYRRIAEKQAGLQFTGEKFYYITKNVDDEDFTIQEVYTSGNLPPFPVTSVNGQTGDVVIAIPVTSVNGRTGNVILAGDNIPYNIDGTYTIEDVITPLEKAIGHVIRYNTCSDGVTAGQYVYLILSGISGRSDGLYKAVNAKSAGTVWTASDLSPVAGGLGALMASNDSSISELNSKFLKKNIAFELGTNVDVAYVSCVEAGDLFTIAFNVNITANLSGGAKILTQIDMPILWTNGFALLLHRNNSNENVSAFLETFPTEGKTLVLAQSTPSGTYRGVITCVKG